MMVALLLYAYSVGIYSSRRIAKACEERVDFMAVTAMRKPDFRTVSDFRKRHLGALSGLFAQVPRLCRRAGLVKLGHVALDGTKIKANASKHKAMSYGRMVKAEARLEGEIASWFAQAAAADAAEDRELGREARGDEMPGWVAHKEKRLARQRRRSARDPSPSRRWRRRRTRRSATSPTPRAASSRPRTASSRATTPKPRSMPNARSSSATA